MEKRDASIPGLSAESAIELMMIIIIDLLRLAKKKAGGREEDHKKAEKIFVYRSWFKLVCIHCI